MSRGVGESFGLGNASPEQMFGPIEQFEIYAKAFGMLESAAGSAYEAWVKGSMSIGDALKASLAQSLLVVGQEMQIQALKNAAYSLAHLAAWDLPGAARYGAAATAFQVGALAAGYGSRALGIQNTGAANNNINPSLPGNRGRGADGGNGGGTVIYMGADFAAQDRRRRASQIRRELKRAQVPTSDAVAFA